MTAAITDDRRPLPQAWVYKYPIYEPDVHWLCLKAFRRWKRAPSHQGCASFRPAKGE